MHKANRRDRRYIKRIMRQVEKAMATNRPYLISAHIGLGMKHAYRVMRNGEAVISYGWEDEEDER